MSDVNTLLQRATALRQAGQLAACIDTYRALLQQAPNFPEGHYNLGNVLLQAGRPAEAAGAYRRALALRPGFIEAENNLGHALLGQLAAAEALGHFLSIAARVPNQPETHANVGAALFILQRYTEAAAAFARAVALRPGDAALWRKRLGAEQARGAGAEVLECARAIAALTGDDVAAMIDLSKSLIDRQAEEAAIFFRRILDQNPDSLETAMLLSSTLIKLDRCAEALAMLDAFPLTAETEAIVHTQRGTLLRNLGRLAEAETVLRRVVAQNPDHAPAQMRLGMSRLLAGDYTEGFALYEQRFAAGLKKFREYAAPLWRGEPLAGRTLLVHAEQGLGDTLQFCRFLPQAAQGGQVVVMAQPPVASLLRGLPGIASVRAQDAPPPPHDCQLPMMSLPFVLGTTIETLPPTPYLHADPERVAMWQARLAGIPGRKIGLCWRGNPESTQNIARSIPAAVAAGLLDMPNTCFVSLQQAADDPLISDKLLDWTRELHDFADTAALVMALDLVISVDTAISHLAGALGKPCWLLNRFNTDWRWLVGRTDSPWYAHHLIFRQTEAGDWHPVLVQVKDALSGLAEVQDALLF